MRAAIAEGALFKSVMIQPLSQQSTRTIIIRLLLLLIGLLLVVLAIIGTLEFESETPQKEKIDPRATCARGSLLSYTAENLADILGHVLHPR